MLLRGTLLYAEQENQHHKDNGDHSVDGDILDFFRKNIDNDDSDDEDKPKPFAFPGIFSKVIEEEQKVSLHESQMGLTAKESPFGGMLFSLDAEKQLEADGTKKEEDPIKGVKESLAKDEETFQNLTAVRVDEHHKETANLLEPQVDIKQQPDTVQPNLHKDGVEGHHPKDAHNDVDRQATGKLDFENLG